MNYGMGGFISPHVDSMKWNDPTSLDYIQRLGPRILTFMIYLSNVSDGGNTVFPQAGLSIKPAMGSVLYWFTIHQDLSYDSRNLHLGCPTVFGNKWIANKWIKLNGQFKTYPCTLFKNDFFRIHNSDMVF